VGCGCDLFLCGEFAWRAVGAVLRRVLVEATSKKPAMMRGAGVLCLRFVVVA